VIWHSVVWCLLDGDDNNKIRKKFDPNNMPASSIVWEDHMQWSTPVFGYRSRSLCRIDYTDYSYYSLSLFLARSLTPRFDLKDFSSKQNLSWPFKCRKCWKHSGNKTQFWFIVCGASWIDCESHELVFRIVSGYKTTTFTYNYIVSNNKYIKRVAKAN